jgi:hypothetical protein
VEADAEDGASDDEDDAEGDGAEPPPELESSLFEEDAAFVAPLELPRSFFAQPEPL